MPSASIIIHKKTLHASPAKKQGIIFSHAKITGSQKHEQSASEMDFPKKKKGTAESLHPTFNTSERLM